jgi:hypothetical protein
VSGGGARSAAVGGGARSFGPAYPALLVLSGLFAAAAVVTLIPDQGARWPCILGYKAFCTFAPASTFACALLAAISCTLRVRLVKRTPAPPFVPVAVIAFLVAGFAWSTAAWAREDAKYVDGSSSASVRAEPGLQAPADVE